MNKPKKKHISGLVGTECNRKMSGSDFTSCLSLYGSGKQTAAGLCSGPAQLCYSSSGGRAVYCRGQGPRHMFTGSLRRAIVVKTPPKHAASIAMILSHRAPSALGPKEAHSNQIPQKHI